MCIKSGKVKVKEPLIAKGIFNSPTLIDKILVSSTGEAFNVASCLAVYSIPQRLTNSKEMRSESPNSVLGDVSQRLANSSSKQVGGYCLVHTRPIAVAK